MILGPGCVGLIGMNQMCDSAQPWWVKRVSLLFDSLRSCDKLFIEHLKVGKFAVNWDEVYDTKEKWEVLGLDEDDTAAKLRSWMLKAPKKCFFLFFIGVGAKWWDDEKKTDNTLF